MALLDGFEPSRFAILEYGLPNDVANLLDQFRSGWRGCRCRGEGLAPNSPPARIFFGFGSALSIRSYEELVAELTNLLNPNG